MLVWLLVKSVIDMSDPANAYGGKAWFGLGPAAGDRHRSCALGVVVMISSRIAGTPFWSERAGVADPSLVRAQAHTEVGS